MLEQKQLTLITDWFIEVVGGWMGILEIPVKGRLACDRMIMHTSFVLLMTCAKPCDFACTF